jgi:hypothetical protein
MTYNTSKQHFIGKLDRMIHDSVIFLKKQKQLNPLAPENF